MHVTREIIACIANRIRPLLVGMVAKYESEKYPPDVLGDLRGAFSERRIRPGDISRALIWKWGHTGKDSFPTRHRKLLALVEGFREDFLSLPESVSARQTFDFWSRTLGRSRRFVSRSFLTHLQHNGDIEIIDQHNWRAMRILLAQCRSGLTLTQLPRNYEDILFTSRFVRALSEAMDTPRGQIDRFLMMYGRHLKRSSPGSTT
jgi:hypothetical protein